MYRSANPNTVMKQLEPRIQTLLTCEQRDPGFPEGCKVKMLAKVRRLDGSLKMSEEEFVVAEARPKPRTSYWEYKLKFFKSGESYKDCEGKEWFLETESTLEKA